MGRLCPAVVLSLAAALGPLSPARGAPPVPAVASPLPAPAGGQLPEPPLPGTGVEADYLRTMHKSIHWRWSNKFIDGVARKRPAKDPLNNPALQVELIFTVRWDGSPAQITVAQSSGNAEFDAAAIAAIQGDGRYPVPPIETYGDDGIAHLRWVFARDQRLCSGGEVRRFEAPRKDALPRLFVQGRTKEALLRVVRDANAGDPAAVSEFARAYLARPFPDPSQDARAAAALARAGDARQVDRLKKALKRADSAQLAAQALVASKVDLCPLVEGDLKADNVEAAVQAASILSEAGAELSPGSPCLTTMTALAKEAPSIAIRAAMLEALAVVSPGGVRRLAMNALDEADPRIRAAGVRAFARPGGGRPTLYRLQPLIDDRSNEVRAAVAGGLIRACGDLAHDHVLPFFKDKDPQPLVAMAPELGKMSSAPSADLLAKMLKRNDPVLRIPVMAALANRHDAAARALYQPLAAAARKDRFALAEVRRIAYSTAEPSELLPQLNDPVIGIYAYKALLRARRHEEAVQWLVTAYDRSSPELMIDALGAWLANPPAPVAKK